jgi:Type I 3-dehydroquinase
MQARTPKLTEIPRPFVCCVLLDDPTPDHVVRTIKLAEYDGADAFDLELQGLDGHYRNREALSRVFGATTRPIFTVYRRYRLAGDAFEEQSSLEAARMQLQLDLIDSGSVGFDMELDTFDPQPGPSPSTPEGKRYTYDRSSPPREVSHDPAAVERQIRLIEEAHRRGGEVMASAHTLTRLSPDGAVAIGRLAEERGADMVKIVQFCASYEDVVECFASTVALRRALRIPFVMMAHGEYGKLVRPVAPLLGSLLVFARQDYAPGSFLSQPLVRATKAVWDNFDFRISDARARSLLRPGAGDER